MSAPVAVGGLGGSGTRVVASWLQQLGYAIGDDLNQPLDNLWFTLLLKRRGLSDAESQACLQVFVEAMQGRLVLDGDRMALLVRAVGQVARHGHDADGAGRGSWAFERLVTLLAAHGHDRAPPRWGWKEPNTHIWLQSLGEQLPGLRYVHVLRHGVDMAFSGNQSQLHWWGPQLGIEVPRDEAHLPAAGLRYWVETTRRAVRIGERDLGDRFLLLRFEDVCDHPRETALRLAAFLDEPLDDALMEALVGVPSAPRSVGRHRERPLEGFASADLEAVEEFGYTVGG